MSDTPIRRRIIPASQASVSSNALRRSQFDQRVMAKQAEELIDRDAQAYETTLQTAASEFTRRDNADFDLDEQQNAAINMMATQQFAVLSGSAGTGKTTTMKKALKRLEAQVPLIDWINFRSAGKENGNLRRPAIALCTFTNVAARNLAAKLDESYSVNCMSIHSMLAYAPVEQEDINITTGRAKIRFEPQYNAVNKLPLKIIIIDEAGIVSKDLWDKIVDACELDTRIYFLGDLAQLPALQGVSPMPFAIDYWPSTHLTKIYRQADGNPIIENLTRIRRGLPPVHNGQHFRCDEQTILPHNAVEARRHVSGYLSALYKRGFWDPKQDILLTPMNEAMLGQLHWNGAFRLAFNPPTYENGVQTNPPVLVGTALGGNMLAIGDKVMATDNGGRGATEKRFVNGSIGIITAIKPNPKYTGDMSRVGELVHDESEDAFDWDDMSSAVAEFNETALEQSAEAAQAEADEEVKSRAASHIITVVEQATGEVFELSRSAEVASLTHAYAATCHKFQGSQARNVIVICHTSMNFGLNREWLYTACSRAQQRVFLLHEPKALNTALARQQIYGNTAQEKAAHLREIYGKRQWARPVLPKPRAL